MPQTPPKQNKTILIAEDEPPLLTILESKLSKAGFDVLAARNGEEALDLAFRHHPDLVLLDIIMPRLDGIAVFRRLREDVWGKTVKVVMLTNLSDPDRLRGVFGINDEQKQDFLDPQSLAGRQMKAFLDSHLGTSEYDYIIKSDWKLEEVVDKIKEKFQPPV